MNPFSRALGCVLLLALLIACVGPQPIFNRYTLDGWQQQGAIQWVVDDQLIVASGSGDGFLASDAQFGDFYLRVEFWPDATVNSGIFIRCKDRSRIYPDTCYELNIWDEHPNQEARTGAIVFVHMPPLAQVATVGQWNVYEVTARGTFVEVKVNGVVTAVLEDADPTPGFLALQHWGEGEVRFRSIELTLY
jgi:hypothetical protein